MSQSPSGSGRSSSAPPPNTGSEVQRLGLRPALTLEELLEHLVAQGLVPPEQAQERAGSRHHPEERGAEGARRLGALAGGDPLRRLARGDRARPANLSHPSESGRRVDEDAIAKALGAGVGPSLSQDRPAEGGQPAGREDALAPFARRHVVVAVGRDADGLVVAVADPYDTTLARAARVAGAGAAAASSSRRSATSSR